MWGFNRPLRLLLYGALPIFTGDTTPRQSKPVFRENSIHLIQQVRNSLNPGGPSETHPLNRFFTSPKGGPRASASKSSAPIFVNLNLPFFQSIHPPEHLDLFQGQGHPPSKNTSVRHWSSMDHLLEALSPDEYDRGNERLLNSLADAGLVDVMGCFPQTPCGCL
jgi:hypothetical protein